MAERRRDRILARARATVDSAFAQSTNAPPQSATDLGMPEKNEVARTDGVRGALQRRTDSIRNVITGMGASDKVNGSRPDIYREALGYEELNAAYRFGGYARRFVDVMPNEATRKGWTVLGETGEAVTGMEDEHDRLHVVERVAEADTWARLYGVGCILMVTTDDVPPEYVGRPNDWLAQPLDLERVISLDSLVVLDWSECTPWRYETDIHNPKFREPKSWIINPNAGGVISGWSSSTPVHASRVLHFRGAKLPPQLRLRNRGIDDSILQAPWDQFRNREVSDHAMADVANELRIAKLKLNDMADVAVSDRAEYFDTRMHQIAKHKSFLNMLLLGPNEEYLHEQGTVSGMGELDDITRKSLQAVTGMPEQVLMGSAPSGLNTDGESHRALWANVIAAYQRMRYKQLLVALYDIMFAAQNSTFDLDAIGSWKVEFEPLDELTEQGKANLRKTTAETDNIYILNGTLSPDRVAEARFGEHGWQDDIPAQETPEPKPFDMKAIEAELPPGQLALPLAGDPASTTSTAAGAAGPAAPLNDAQIQAAQGLLVSVAIGQIPPEAAQLLLQGIVSADLAEAMIAAMGDPDPAAAIRTAQLAEQAQLDAITVVDGALEQSAKPGVDLRMQQARAFADMMNEHSVDRCEHGYVNKCDKCGIERVRGVTRDPDTGEPKFAIRWQAIGDVPVVDEDEDEDDDGAKAAK